VAHAGQFQFLEVRNNRKPFGEAVIQAHRLLKNSVPSDNYVLISNDLAKAVELSTAYQDRLYRFQQGENTYDNKKVSYLYSEIPVDQLKVKSFQEGKEIAFDRKADLLFELTYPVAADALLELITNYKYRHLWSGDGVKIEYNENEVTRLGSVHTCVIGGKHFDFEVITKRNEQGELVYGEATGGPPIVDQLYQFFHVDAVNQSESKLIVEIYWEAKAVWKKLTIKLLAGKILRKNVAESLDKLLQLSMDSNLT
jgi:hypothetical protein